MALPAEIENGFAGFLLYLSDTVFELQAVLGDVAGRQRGLDGAQLPHKSRTRLLIDRAARSPVILGQRRDCPTQQLLVIRHWLLGTHSDSAVL
ncbi:MAG: hypothetical protein ABS75_12805 [Pelagibacterium sp. SCN 63-23]|nr:MAG: hypothetical protein ABS75_12805 [Pelagibacterium sp. SCN 63-23]